jgi:hypothetical protein
LRNFYVINDFIIAPDDGRIHIFSTKGAFIKDIKLDSTVFPSLFIDENQMIKPSFPPFPKRSEPNFIELYDMTAKTSKKLAKLEAEEEFLTYSGKNLAMVIRIGDTTPGMVYATDYKSLFFAHSAKYQVKKIDLNGKELLSFSIEGRKRNRISRETKINQFKNTVRNFSNIPQQAVDEMIKQIPDESPYFSRILIDSKGMIYLLIIDMERQDKQFIDIFSPKGDYLYRSTLDLSNEFETISTLAFSFDRKELFAFGDDAEGDRQLVKYKIDLPN